MCGRYAIFGPASASREAKEAMDRLGVDIVSEINQRDDQFNVAPTHRAPVLAAGQHGVEVKALRWGLIPSWAKDEKIGARTINARADTIASKPAFRAAFKRRRCLVPASGYFEWTGDAGHKQPWFIHAPDNELLVFAGLWEAWRPSEQAEWLRTFTVVTGEPGEVSKDIHDRQPVVLPPETWSDWLTGTPEEAAAVLGLAHQPDLMFHPVAKAVGSPRSNGPELVEPIELGAA